MICILIEFVITTEVIRDLTTSYRRNEYGNWLSMSENIQKHIHLGFYNVQEKYKHTDTFYSRGGGHLDIRDYKAY